ncbi:hypothetical protein [Streptomyces sp. NBC_01176]|uniref:hypothetical protein n=1 Tax=Streptomyces sp. NBC_01176 TaxID=2903760 RepID=UPI00386DBFD0|nr:hypothetical protein OG199_11855 [Streptomyces sp. NBC_01176]
MDTRTGPTASSVVETHGDLRRQYDGDLRRQYDGDLCGQYDDLCGQYDDLCGQYDGVADPVAVLPADAPVLTRAPAASGRDPRQRATGAVDHGKSVELGRDRAPPDG